jgi:arsenical pump membrane protein
VHAVWAVVLFVCVWALVLARPWGLSVGWPAALGGALAVALGVVPAAEAWQVIRLVWDATLTFVAVVVLSLLLDEVGLFRWAALHMVRLARGQGQRLFLLSLLLGAVVAAVFTNDGAALILTPIVYEMVSALGLPPPAVLAFVMASGFVADATSVPLVASNLVNILSADFFHMGFAAYAARMLPVDALSLLASAGVLLAVYGRSIPAHVPLLPPEPPSAAIRDGRLFRLSGWALGLLLAGYLLSQFLHFPVSVAAVGATVLFAGAARTSPAVRLGTVLREAPWNIVVFSAGMYVVVFGLRDAGLIHGLAHLVAWAYARGATAGILATGGLAALLSSVWNNLPTVMVDALAIASAHVGRATSALALANVVGSDLGPKMSPLGSLATLLWLHVLKRRGMRISWGYYVRVGVVLTVPVLAAALVGLTLVLRI